MTTHRKVTATERTHASLLPVFLIVLVDVFGLTLVLPLLAIYAESFHATALQATLLVSVFAVCQLVSGPLIGHASDRTGRRDSSKHRKRTASEHQRVTSTLLRSSA